MKTVWGFVLIAGGGTEMVRVFEPVFGVALGEADADGVGVGVIEGTGTGAALVLRCA